MKITKIPGLGRFGVFVDDLKIDDLNNDRWLLLGEEPIAILVMFSCAIKAKPANDV